MADMFCSLNGISSGLILLSTNLFGILTANTKGNQPWILIGSTEAEAEAPILWPPDAKSWLTGKDPDCWEKLKAGGEGDDRGWDGWMASLTQWRWVWVNCGNWRWTGRSGMLQPMRPQRVGHDWVTELRDREAWRAAVHGVAKSWTGLGDWTTFLSKPAHTSNSSL